MTISRENRHIKNRDKMGWYSVGWITAAVIAAAFVVALAYTFRPADRQDYNVIGSATIPAVAPTKIKDQWPVLRPIGPLNTTSGGAPTPNP